MQAQKDYKIRTSRLQSLREKRSTNYIDIDMLKKEVEEAKKFAQKTIGQLLMYEKIIEK